MALPAQRRVKARSLNFISFLMTMMLLFSFLVIGEPLRWNLVFDWYKRTKIDL